ncbi:hypothetical protein BURCENBC7_AP8052 [Burkholderia cenocepacia BC7]|nr:uncharacterized protein BCN122_I0017 [Burkholderia cenocepacia]EPZ92031.1 hypothetical protein BURCENK562V_C2141 [Burkholderia cenocepacia K56-2Valvano]ERI30415.1 hypothetical protein BURCENBC7_AP8052 [Burkholderia cenocepacia BC7]
MRNKLPSRPFERQDPCKPRRRAAFFRRARACRIPQQVNA